METSPSEGVPDRRFGFFTGFPLFFSLLLDPFLVDPFLVDPFLAEDPLVLDPLDPLLSFSGAASSFKSLATDLSQLIEVIKMVFRGVRNRMAFKSIHYNSNPPE